MKKCLLGLLSILCVASCGRRIVYEIPEELRQVRITPQWGESPLPEKLSALFYTPDGALYKEFPLPVEGGVVSVPNVDYRLIVYSPEIESVAFSALDLFDSALGRIQASNTKSHYELFSPGRLYTATDALATTTLEAKPDMVKRSFQVTLNLKSVLVGASYRVSLHNLADVLNLSTGAAYHDEDTKTGLLWLDHQGFLDGHDVFTGRSFGGCLNPTCQWGGEHQMQAQVDVAYASGEQSSFLVNVTEPMLKAQEKATPLLVEIEVLEREVRVSSTVGDWSSGVSIGAILD